MKTKECLLEYNSSVRDPFKQLLSNCKKNSVTQDENGNWNQIRSSTNRRRMNGDGASDQTKIWTTSKLLVTSEDLKMVWDKQKGKCYWFDIDLDLNLLYKDHKDWYPKHPLAPSVDKIDESGDYSINNIVICCRFANFGRNVYPFDRMQDLISTLTKKG